MRTRAGPADEIDEDRAWGAELADRRASWYRPLAPELISHLMSRVAPWSSEPAALTKLRLTAEDRALWEPHFALARHDLEKGRGFVILDHLPLDDCSIREVTGLYWLVGQYFGEPMEQNVQGTLLYDVWDTGQDIASGARFSVTRYESSFHTDNSFGDSIVDYVGLLCLRAAKLGGTSQNVSGHRVCEVLRREHPDVLKALSSPFHVDRRGGIREGELPTVRRPVVAWNESGLLIRYLRYWIEAGHVKVAEPLTAAQRQALDILDGVVQRPDLRVEFALQPGQICFINNRWILHNRTEFTDYPEPELRRHFARLWLRAQT
jgi:alpha-ketoglutarate-dependent taurine dioxygenase